MQQAGQLHLLVAQLVLQVEPGALGLGDAHVGGRHVEAGAHAGLHALVHFVAVGLQRGNLLVLHPNTLAHEQDVVVHLRRVEGQVAAGHRDVVLGRLHLRLGHFHGRVVLAEVEQQVLRREVKVVVVVGCKLQHFTVERQLHHRVDAGVSGRARYLGQEPGPRLTQAAGRCGRQFGKVGDAGVGIEHGL